MRIAVSESLCSGHGRCYVLAPDIFQSDEDGFCSERGQELEVAPGQEEAATTAVGACPEGAITIL
jgi:ferredoxin